MMKKNVYRIFLICCFLSMISTGPLAGAIKTVQQYKAETGLPETAASFHFTVFSENADFSRRALDRLEKALEKIQADLQVKRSLRKRCLVFIWKNRLDYLEKIAAMGDPGLAFTGGFSVSAVDRLPHQLYLYNSDELFDTVIPHELGHLVLEVTLNGSRQYRVPLWLHEGFAQCQEEKDYAPVARSLAEGGGKGLIPLGELTAISAYPEDPGRRLLFYREAEGLVRFLIAEQTSPGEFFYLARKMVFWAEDLEPALRSRYGGKFSTLNQLEEIWIRDLRHYFGDEE